MLPPCSTADDVFIVTKGVFGFDLAGKPAPKFRFKLGAVLRVAAIFPEPIALEARERIRCDAATVPEY
jgi:hypothetical protein